jgi:nicotinate phosphoribosyltransferase
LIISLKDQGARIDLWGVGTRMITAYDQPALGGVYKLSAIRRNGGPWQPKVKVSEQAIKVSNPGVLQVRRFVRDGEAAGDMIWDETSPNSSTMIDPMDLTRRKTFDDGYSSEELLVPVYRAGRRVYDPPSLEEVRARRVAQLALFHGGVKRFVNPHRYPVGLEQHLYELKTKLVMQARGVTE